jgi:hypothetical protein
MLANASTLRFGTLGDQIVNANALCGQKVNGLLPTFFVKVRSMVG